MKNIFYSFFLLFFLNSCVTLVPPTTTKTPPTTTGGGNTKSVYLQNFPESFESASKSTYTAGTVSFPSGEWYFNEALIGTTDNDTKTGTKAIRLRDNGVVGMNFNVLGVKDVKVSHAAYGSDGDSNWELWISTNSGKAWKKVGITAKTNGNKLSSTTFSVDVSVNVRFEIRKIGEDGNRLNIDEIALTPYSGGAAKIIVATRDEPLVFGNPSNANRSDENNYLMEKDVYSLSYNRKKGTANWVSWHLSSAWKGNAKRTNNFRSDNTLPSDWFHASTSDYTDSGFDRGHLCPSDDRDASVEENDETFLMTNIVPQAPNNNRGPWKDLEEFSRQVAARGYELYITAGVYGIGGVGSTDDRTKYLANGKITVPEYVWKVIVINPIGSSEKRKLTTNTRVIVVKMPNKQWVGGEPWGDFRVSVDELEKLLGYDFLADIDAGLEQILEKNVDTGTTNAYNFPNLD